MKGCAHFFAKKNTFFHLSLYPFKNIYPFKNLYPFKNIKRRNHLYDTAKNGCFLRITFNFNIKFNKKKKKKILKKVTIYTRQVFFFVPTATQKNVSHDKGIRYAKQTCFVPTARLALFQFFQKNVSHDKGIRYVKKANSGSFFLYVSFFCTISFFLYAKKANHLLRDTFFFIHIFFFK